KSWWRPYKRCPRSLLKERLSEELRERSIRGSMTLKNETSTCYLRRDANPVPARRMSQEASPAARTHKCWMRPQCWQTNGATSFYRRTHRPSAPASVPGRQTAGVLRAGPTTASDRDSTDRHAAGATTAKLNLLPARSTQRRHTPPRRPA